MKKDSIAADAYNIHFKSRIHVFHIDSIAMNALTGNVFVYLMPEGVRLRSGNAMHHVFADRVVVPSGMADW
jgi:hypothetical protein